MEIQTQTAPPRHRRVPWQTLLIEIFSVMLAVLLALGVNAWWQARKDAALVKTATANFVREIQRNRDEVQRLVPYYEQMQEVTAAMYAEGQARTVEMMMQEARNRGFRGFRPPFLTDAAWETALAAQVLPNMPYRHTFTLSTLYTMQKRVSTFTEQFSHSMLSPEALTDGLIRQTMLNASIYFNDLTSMSRTLVRMYDQTLAVLEVPEGPEETTPADSSR